MLARSMPGAVGDLIDRTTQRQDDLGKTSGPPSGLRPPVWNRLV